MKFEKIIEAEKKVRQIEELELLLEKVNLYKIEIFVEVPVLGRLGRKISYDDAPLLGKEVEKEYDAIIQSCREKIKSLIISSAQEEIERLKKWIDEL